MTQESVITDEMRAAINVESEPYVNDIEKGAIIKFAEAIGDDNPLFNDEEAGQKFATRGYSRSSNIPAIYEVRP